MLSLYDDKGEHLEEEVMQLVEVTTRWREGSPRTRSLCLKSQKGPSAWESGDSETIFFLFSGGLTVSLLTVHLTDLRFLFFFISVLGEVVATGGDGPVLAVLGAELPPLEVLTNPSS